MITNVVITKPIVESSITNIIATVIDGFNDQTVIATTPTFQTIVNVPTHNIITTITEQQ